MEIKVAKFSRRQIIKAIPVAAMVSSTSVQAAPAAPQAPRFPASKFLDSVGVCTHFGQDSTPGAQKFDALMPLLQGLGVRHLRDEAIVTVRTSKDTPQYQRIRQCVEAGFRFSMICFDPNNDYVFTPPSMVEDIFDWCAGGIDMFEGSNEPNLTKSPWRQPLVSREHQTMLYEKVKNSPKLKSIPVAGPSYVQANVKLALAQQNTCDYANIHAYPGMEHPETVGNGSLSRFSGALRPVFGNKPMVVTEIGYHTAVQTKTSFFPVSDDIKVRYLPRTLLFAFMKGAVRTYLYEFVSSFPDNPANPESLFGLIRNDLSKTAAYDAIKAMLGFFAAGKAQPRRGGEVSVQFLSPDSNQQALIFDKDDGSTLVAVWLAIPAWRWPGGQQQPPKLTKASFKIDGAHSKVVANRLLDDGTVDTKSLDGQGGQYEFLASDQVTFLEITS